MTHELEDGFYWVRLRSDTAWELAYLLAGKLLFVGAAKPVNISDVHEIDPRPIKRDNGGE